MRKFFRRQLTQFPAKNETMTIVYQVLSIQSCVMAHGKSLKAIILIKGLVHDLNNTYGLRHCYHHCYYHHKFTVASIILVGITLQT